jgi:hypothetical protein
MPAALRDVIMIPLMAARPPENRNRVKIVLRTGIPEILEVL